VRWKIFGLPTTALEVYVVILLVSATCAYGVCVWKDVWESARVWKWPAGAWTFVTLTAVAWSVAPIAGLGLWRAYVLEPITIFFLLRHILRDEDKERMKNAMYAMAGVFGFWGVAQVLTGHGYLVPESVMASFPHRAMGPFPYPNALALFVGPIGTLALVEWMKRGSAWRLSTWVVAFAGVAVAQSQGGLLAMGGTAFILFIAEKRFRKFAIAFAGVAIMSCLAIPRLGALLYHQLTFQGWSGQVRLFLWRDTLHMLRDHWFTGAGFAGFPTLFAKYQSTQGIEIFQYPHNIVLNVWSEVGVMGVLAFGWVCATWFRLARSWRDTMPLVAILLHGLVDVPYFKNDLSMIFWILILLA
jgi:hypothetical protein